ncbi:MAG: imidazole glycerol phosphate synthase subunit HisH, partial [Raineya sp.]
RSVLHALARLGVEGILTDSPEILQNADKVIFPGVGEAGSAMKYLQEKGLDEVIKNLRQPVLGICLGLQLLCKHSQESNTKCLGIFDLNVKLFPKNTEHKVPHIGWNTISGFKDKVFEGILENDYVYYVHSYYAELGKETIAQTDYILPFSAALQKDNFWAMQFHPEKSGKIGEILLKKFLNL